MKFTILTLFPEMFESPLQASLIGKAIERGDIAVDVVNIRDFAKDKHKQADDYPFGGGVGMVMKADVVLDALRAVRTSAEARTVYLGPGGKTLDQPLAFELAEVPELILLCGHYEGIDERALEAVDLSVSIGDYILTGGELPALVLLDAVARLVPGVVGCRESVMSETFSHGRIEHPQYTRPRLVNGQEVPEVLLSGNHAAIRQWRKKESIRKTLQARPDLLFSRPLDEEEQRMLIELIQDGEGARQET